MKNFYTAKEAQERLGMNNNSFHYLVRKGTLKGVTLPGRKYHVYPKTEIDRFAATLKTAIEQYERDSSLFEPATLDDLLVEYQIDMSLFGRRATTPMEARIDRLQKNPEGNYVLRNAGEIVGYISFYPLDPNVVDDILSGRIGVIPIERVATFEQGKPLHVYIFVIGVKSGFPPDVARHYGLRLLTGAVQVFRELGKRGILIERLAATSRTSFGIKLCKKLGMQGEEIEGERGQWRFTLDIASSNSLLVQEYKQAYAEYLKLQADDLPDK
jgi:hypothetical protein